MSSADSSPASASTLASAKSESPTSLAFLLTPNAAATATIAIADKETIFFFHCV